MRNIIPAIPKAFQSVVGDPAKITTSTAIPIGTFRELVEVTATFAFHNKDYMLFYRGQANDYHNKGGGSTFYPTIYRGDYLPHRELRNRFDILEGASKALVDLFETKKIEGFRDLKRRKLIQWSVVQHYEVCETPLLDFTHSLRVACSFAHMKNKSDKAYVFMFGFPYLTNRISLNSEHDLVNVRLLSICPPTALRPQFQEGYLAGTDEVTDVFESKTELDFNNRLIAKFEIPTNKLFWGRIFHQIPEDSLYPKSDPIKTLCDQIRDQASMKLKSGDLGDFLKTWAEIEELVTTHKRADQGRYLSFRQSLSNLVRECIIDKNLYYQLDQLRSFRNLVIHEAHKVKPGLIENYLGLAKAALRTLRQTLKSEQGGAGNCLSSNVLS
ncbi:MAG: FRG domain-containing protein [bacterium]|nr:FRG domain-containing protein [bacterium]